MKVILDANVVIAAAASRGLCEAVMELCLEYHQIFFCEKILGEIEEKLTKKIKVPSIVVAEYLQFLKNNAQVFIPVKVDKISCRDPKDLMILGLVVPAHANVIITGDKDLLVLKKYKTARIISPRDFWEINKKEK